MELAHAHPETRLPVADLDTSEQWYADHLGLIPHHRRPGYLIYQLTGGTFALFASTGRSTSSFSQMALELTDGIQDVVRHMQSRGVTFKDYGGLAMTDGVATIRATPTGPPIDYAAWFEDPDGNLIALLQLVSPTT